MPDQKDNLIKKIFNTITDFSDKIKHNDTINSTTKKENLTRT